MKKVLVLATAALLISGVSFAQDKAKTKEKENVRKSAARKMVKQIKIAAKKKLKQQKRKQQLPKQKLSCFLLRCLKNPVTSYVTGFFYLNVISRLGSCPTRNLTL